MSAWTPDVEWTWPDVTAAVIDYLSVALGGDATVAARIPDPRPERLVRVQRAGGVAQGVFDRARIQIECSTPRVDTATELCLTVRDLMRRMPWADEQVSRVVEVTGPTLLSDPVDIHQVCLLAVEVTVRPTPAEPPAS